MRDVWQRSSPCPQYRSERIRQQLWNWVGSWVGCLVVQSPPVIEGFGRGEWIRTTHLLVPNLILGVLQRFAWTCESSIAAPLFL